jgi:CheY-like chemotaxis protein
VKSFVELHGGSVSVESARGDGSTFRFTLPLVAAEDAPPGDDLATGITEETGLFRILVVEDDPAAFQLVESALRDAGYIPLRARSGEEALELAKTLRPAAITLDLVLPGLDGWAVLKTLKSDPETRDMPVVIVSRLKSETGLASSRRLPSSPWSDRFSRLAALFRRRPLPQRVPSSTTTRRFTSSWKPSSSRGYVVEGHLGSARPREGSFAAGRHPSRPHDGRMDGFRWPPAACEYPACETPCRRGDREDSQDGRRLGERSRRSSRRGSRTGNASRP